MARLNICHTTYHPSCCALLALAAHGLASTEKTRFATGTSLPPILLFPGALSTARTVFVVGSLLDGTLVDLRTWRPNGAHSHTEKGVPWGH